MDERKHEISEPLQGDLFNLDNESQSQVIDLYSLVPRFIYGKQNVEHPDHGHPSDSVITRRFSVGDHEYELTLTAAVVRRSSEGKDEYVRRFPGRREELVEAAMYYMASHGNLNFSVPGSPMNKMAGCYYTVHAIQQNLKSFKKTYSHNEIVEALDVLHKANLQLTEVTTKGLRNVIDSPMFPVKYNQEELRENGISRGWVAFHPLTAESIKSLRYRQIDYAAIMRMKTPLASYLYLRLVNRWTQASQEHPYRFKATTLLADAAMPWNQKNVTKTRDRLHSALDELVKEGKLSRYIVEEVKRTGRKITDELISLYPTPAFVDEVKRANAEKTRRLAAAAKDEVRTKGIGVRARRQR